MILHGVSVRWEQKVARCTRSWFTSLRSKYLNQSHRIGNKMSVLYRLLFWTPYYYYRKMKMTRTVGLGLLLAVLAVLVTHHALGFSPAPVVDLVPHHRHGSSRSNRRLPLVTRRLSSETLNQGGAPIWKTSYVDVEKAEVAAKRQYDINLFIVAGIPPVAAFALYTHVARQVANVFDMLGFKGTNVDGNAFATNLLRPTINGVVGEFSAIDFYSSALGILLLWHYIYIAYKFSHCPHLHSLQS